MHFKHANVGFASAHNYLQGWNDTFMKLEKLIDTQYQFADTERGK
ncbi:MAG TPA: hypothetical protein VG738_09560 [Chitinophagaceae bacterium]|nr:hypothetical protein [Chitinophagaceae bacterium]